MKKETRKQEKKLEIDNRVNELEKMLEQEKVNRLTVLAEFQNYKKRLENEKNDYRVFATKMIISQLMQILDDFGRAKKDIEEKIKDSKVQSEVLNSIKMLNEKIAFIVMQNGYEEIPAKTGDKFNPELMEAITSVEVKDKKDEGTLIHVDQKGYKHIESGIVFRTAKVIVGKLNS